MNEDEAYVLTMGSLIHGLIAVHRRLIDAYQHAVLPVPIKVMHPEPGSVVDVADLAEDLIEKGRMLREMQGAIADDLHSMLSQATCHWLAASCAVTMYGLQPAAQSEMAADFSIHIAALELDEFEQRAAIEVAKG